MSALNPALVKYEPKPRENPALPALLKPSRPAKVGENHIRQAFIGVNMAYQHTSLRLICEEKGINPDKLKRGDFVLFVNAKWTRMKLLAMGEVILYLKAPGEQQISAEFLEQLPRIFGSDQAITYDHAVKQLFDRFTRPSAKVTRNVQTGRRRKTYVSPETEASKPPVTVIVRRKEGVVANAKSDRPSKTIYYDK